MFQKLNRSLYVLSAIIAATAIISFMVALQAIFYYGKDLPDYRQLEEYDPPGITRLYTKDGHILDEVATENRIYIQYHEIPNIVVNAFITAEDRTFFKHEGLDPMGIVRAACLNIINMGQQKNPVGGSTITQQVVKNFLLNNERSLARKIKEAILAYRISRVYSKDQIMELYLNQIYLGNNSYGIASASLNYFNKELKDLTLEEVALLAALPKAPSQINPIKNPHRARERRNWVLAGMLEEGYITQEEYDKSSRTPITLKKRRKTDFFHADYYATTVREELINRLGEEVVYNDGLQVFTNVDERLQRLAEDTLKNGLLRYDKKYGYRGPLGYINPENREWQQELVNFPAPLDIGDFQLALVLKVDPEVVTIGLEQGKNGVIPLNKMNWARKNLKGQTLGPVLKSAKEVLKKGDVILVKNIKSSSQEYTLEQIPEVNGAILVLETHSGRVLAEVGGYDYKKSNFNRVTQALRQPGSTFKTFLTLSALEQGYTPQSIVYDEPIELSQGPGMPPWRPKNMHGDYLGAITLRKSLEKSRNLSTVWLMTKLGLNPIIEVSERLDIYHNPPRNYSMALGAFETKVLNMTNAFNVIASGGRRVEPSFIDRVYNRHGELIYSSDARKFIDPDTIRTEFPPPLFYQYDQLIDEDINYQMISILEGAVKRGTAVRVSREIKKNLAGKTGTTNDSFDTWFIGFSPDIVVGIYVGFDQPRTLGQKESGSSLPLPMFIDFMKEALKDIPSRAFDVPDNVEIVNIHSTERNASKESYEVVRKSSIQKKSSIDEILGEVLPTEENSHTHKELEEIY